MIKNIYKKLTRKKLIVTLGAITSLTAPILTVVSCGDLYDKDFDFEYDLSKVEDKFSTHNASYLIDRLENIDVGDSIGDSILGIKFYFTPEVSAHAILKDKSNIANGIVVSVTLHKRNLKSKSKDIIIKPKLGPETNWDPSKKIAGHLIEVDNKTASVVAYEDDQNLPQDRYEMASAIKEVLQNLGKKSFNLKWSTAYEYNGIYRPSWGKYHGTFVISEVRFTFDITILRSTSQEVD